MLDANRAFDAAPQAGFGTAEALYTEAVSDNTLVGCWVKQRSRGVAELQPFRLALMPLPGTARRGQRPHRFHRRALSRQPVQRSRRRLTPTRTRTWPLPVTVLAYLRDAPGSVADFGRLRLRQSALPPRTSPGAGRDAACVHRNRRGRDTPAPTAATDAADTATEDAAAAGPAE
ncbi:MAG: hypothetical protein R3A10_21245 [Caldilineaceae bacterium]